MVSAATAGAIMIMGCGLLYATWRELNSPLSINGESVVFEVKEGTAMGRFANELQSRGLVAHAAYLNWYARVSGDATRLKAGEFEIPAGTTQIELLEQIVSGQVRQYSFTIIEGWTFAELLEALRNDDVLEDTAINGDDVMVELGQPDVHPEGQFLPDTYRFPRGTTALDLLKRAHDAMTIALENAWRRRSNSVALSSSYEALILASIIEKETALASERREISGVFNRRLERGIRLQTDPTVIYGLGERFDGNLRRRDIVTDTPYNTYTRRGLPPTPIAMPGAASIDASVDPADSDALYFVATGLGDGSHVFSNTLEEHNLAVERYLQQLRSNDQ